MDLPSQPRTLRGMLLLAGISVASVFLAMTASTLAVMAWSLIVLNPRMQHDIDLRAALRTGRDGMLDQETGIRGYLLTGDREFLEPYDTGRMEVDDSWGRVERLRAQSDPAFVDLRRAQQNWMTGWAVAAATTPPRNPDGSVSGAFLAEGKRLFDGYRGTEGGLFTRLDRHAQHGQAQLGRLLLVSVLTSAGGLVIGAVIGGISYRRLRSATVGPVREIVSVMDRVSAGDMSARSHVTSPAETATISARLNDMTAALHRGQVEIVDRNSALAASNAELEQFAYVASHDLSEPLRVIAGFTQLIAAQMDGQLSEDTRQYMTYVLDATERMRTLIQDLLTFSRVGSRAGAIAPVDLNELARQAVADLHVAIEEAAGTVTVDALPVVPADRAQARQLLQNLIGNAVKFRAPDRPPRVRVSARQVSDTWEFCVADNGIGIDPQYYNRVFAMFERLHNRDEYPGTGIGLAVCKKIVERHGGRMWIESTLGAGTTFCFTLSPSPLVATDHRPRSAAVA